jgi:hypothetical protein
MIACMPTTRARRVCSLIAPMALAAGACGSSGGPDEVLLDGAGCPVPAAPGPAPRLLATQVPSPAALALDGTSVWFTAYAGGAIGRVPRQGGATPAPVIGPIPFPTGLAVDDAAVYFTMGRGAVQRWDRAQGSLVELAVDQPRPQRPWLDGETLYWINRGTDSGHIHDPRPNHDGGLARVSTHGGPVEVLHTGEDTVSDLAIAGGVAYLTSLHREEGPRILAVPLDGGAPFVVSREHGGLSGIAVHGDFVYWTRPRACAIRRASIHGDLPRTIATDENVPGRIAADGEGLVWSNAGSFGKDFEGSEIVAAELDGSGRRVLAAARNGWALALTPDAVYFTNNHHTTGDVAVADRR